MKSILAFSCLLFVNSALAQSYYREDCDSNATEVNVKTGVILDPQQSRMLTHGAGIEWTVDKTTYKIVMEKIHQIGTDAPEIQQIKTVSKPGPKPNQTLDTTTLKDFMIVDTGKVGTKDTTAITLVTTVSPTEITDSDAGGSSMPLPDFKVDDIKGPGGRDTSVQIMMSSYGPIGDILEKSMVNVCTTVPTDASGIIYKDFFAGVKGSVQTFTTQYNQVTTAKTALDTCLANPKPTDCSKLQSAYTAAAAKLDTLWLTVVKTPTLPPPSDDGGGSVVTVPGDNSCGFTSQCPYDQACISNQCVAAPECTGRSDCSSNESCVNGSCESNNGSGCTSSSDCMGSEQCLMGVCTSDASKGGCRQDDDCEPGYRCGPGDICTN